MGGVVALVALGAVAAYVVSGTFTPGPNNVLSSSIAMAHGYRKTLPFMLGVTTGFALVLALCGVSAALLLSAVPRIEPVLRWVGAAYIVWLAWSVWTHRESLGGSDGSEDLQAVGFLAGFTLQFVNPKVAVYGLTLYSTLLASIVSNLSAVAGSAIVLALVGFASMSTWAFVGTGIGRWLRGPRERAIAAGVLVALLLYTAYEMVG